MEKKNIFYTIFRSQKWHLQIVSFAKHFKFTIINDEDLHIIFEISFASETWV